MKNTQFRFILSLVAVFSIWTASALKASAAPVRFEQIRQIVNARPGKAATGAFEQLRLIGDDPIVQSGGGTDDKTKNGDGTTQPQPQSTPPPPPTEQPQDNGRVIVETSSEIVEDDVCDCTQPTVEKSRFPYALLALGAIPLLFLIPHGKHTPTPTPGTPTPTPPCEGCVITPPPTPTPTARPTGSTRRWRELSGSWTPRWS